MGGFSIFWLRRLFNPPSSIFGARTSKNPPPSTPFGVEDRRNRGVERRSRISARSSRWQIGLKIYLIISNPKPRHTTGGSERVGSRRDGEAGLGGEGSSFILSRRWKNDLLGATLEERTKETLCKPSEEQNQRLTRGLYG